MLIYKATFPNGKLYIGKTTRKLNNRIYHHIYNSKVGKNIMSKAIVKYGPNNIIWNIIEENIKSLEELNLKEIFYINFYKSNDFNFGYNLTKGGDGGDTISDNVNKLNIIKNRLVSSGYNPDNYIELTEELEKEIVFKYVNEVFSIRQLVKDYKISKNRITRLLKSENVIIRQNMSSITNTLKINNIQTNIIVSKYKEGRTINIIAKEEKLTIMIVSRVLHDLGIRLSKRFINGKRYNGRQPKINETFFK